MVAAVSDESPVMMEMHKQAWGPKCFAGASVFLKQPLLLLWCPCMFSCLLNWGISYWSPVEMHMEMEVKLMKELSVVLKSSTQCRHALVFPNSSPIVHLEGSFCRNLLWDIYIVSGSFKFYFSSQNHLYAKVVIQKNGQMKIYFTQFSADSRLT